MYADTITPSQFALLDAIVHSEFHDGQAKIGNHVWVFSATDSLPAASRGGVVAQALAAGLIEHQQSWDRVNGQRIDASTIAITQPGWDAWEAATRHRAE